jgi:uncharacterized protein YxeA
LAVILAVSVANVLILLVSITLLVIGGVLIVKRRRHVDNSSVQMHDEARNNIAMRRSGEDTADYQELDISKMDATGTYARRK